MLQSVIGGALTAAAFLLIAIMRGTSQRERRPFWSRSEMIESTAVVGLVCMISLGFAFIIRSTAHGTLAPFVGLAVAMAGVLAAVLLGMRLAPASKRSSAA